MSSSAYNRWETFVSVVGVLTAIPLILTIVALQLPTRKVAGLFETLASADAQLHESIEEGLLEDHHIKLFTEQLKLLQTAARDLRDRANSATDLTENFKNLIKGLTSQIRCIEYEAMKLRAAISTASTRQREERARAEARRLLAAGGGGALEGSDPCTPKLYTKVWRFLKETPRRFLSLIFPWRSEPPTKSNGCIPLREDPDVSLPSLENDDVYAVPPSVPATLSSLPASSSGDSPSSEDHVAEQQPSRRRARDTHASPAAGPAPSRGWHTPSFRGWKNPRSFPSRFRTLLRPVAHHHRRHPRRASSCDADDDSDVLLISMAELSSIEPLQPDDDADDWEDVETRKVRPIL
ncbi:uncharacterized protein TRAVEDRAFT_74384 [Trametes versicolor FP-101664 SS1]|uniref:uncharacterized protein n=1 Tax=Trametes versicolor (strain FP-101664) TaxID=717944 RepID=UPI00046248A4|nr:uncharacterized protein TRAVEDRAFT_74384 [Trametes versicolor FP-101664 SS1]EIW54123.1 hypothetical protein TRAVEDRAFT_74384 [Trametes versicolor FP-101664 SS1]